MLRNRLLPLLFDQLEQIRHGIRMILGFQMILERLPLDSESLAYDEIRFLQRQTIPFYGV